MSTMFGVNRRRFLAGAAGTSALAFSFGALAAEAVSAIGDLHPGDFTWTPEIQPTGPVAVVVSLPEQLVHVYRNGVRIALSTCSSGKPGHTTPTGVFVVLQKDKNHHSSTYNNAPMPNMNRLTWSGIALHAGDLPGYPASHGCVRLPLEFSALLFEVTHIGTPVIIADDHSAPFDVVHPGLVLSGYAESEFVHVVDGLEGKQHPSDWTSADENAVTSVVASTADRKVLLLENGNLVTEGTLTVKGDTPLGDHVFVLRGAHPGQQGMFWSAITHDGDDSTPMDRAAESAIDRVSADTPFVEAMKQRMHPGMVMILTDKPLEPDSRTGEDFLIMS